MLSKDDSIVVALAADQNYYKGLLVTACSMARHANNDCLITWVILDGGISPDDIGDLKQCISNAYYGIIPKVCFGLYS